MVIIITIIIELVSVIASSAVPSFSSSLSSWMLSSSCHPLTLPSRQTCRIFFRKEYRWHYAKIVSCIVGQPVAVKNSAPFLILFWSNLASRVFLKSLKNHPKTLIKTIQKSDRNLAPKLKQFVVKLYNLLCILSANLGRSFAQQNYLIAPLAPESLHFLRYFIHFVRYTEGQSKSTFCSTELSHSSIHPRILTYLSWNHTFCCPYWGPI